MTSKVPSITPQLAVHALASIVTEVVAFGPVAAVVPVDAASAATVVPVRKVTP